jgi:hypothetical protein
MISRSSRWRHRQWRSIASAEGTLARPPTREEDIVEDTSRSRRWLGRLATFVGLLFVTVAGGAFLLSRADGPVFVFAGGPLRSGEQVNFADMDWETLDALHELELEIVGTASSRTLWFSVHEGAPYLACDLDCIDGRLARWPQQIERDNRVVIRIDAMRVEGRLIHVPHGSAEYAAARAGRERKYSGEEGGRAGAETAAHSAVVEVGESLTGRAKRKEPGDRLYRMTPRVPERE